ncbi:MAG: polyribonucleotide nucleotidyltransferase [Chloroflexi bacterium]|nr:MAG: polyribonucleotide nucleotidyltransferase [Chloroflexota bacterium]TMG71253.1 MAG: polyribonucleotide nucleotidyltransferase [Chloroflexota bacterium]
MSATRSQAQINAKPFVFETGKLAEQAGGAVTVRYGDTVVFAAATVSPTVRPGIDFFPLTVDFEERLYAAGKIPGSFPRREGRPSEEGILTARLTDRPIRPLFPKGFRNDVQIVVTPFSADQENEPDILAVNAASAALAISPAPFDGPIGCVRVGTVDGKLTLNPTIQELEESELDLVVAGTRDAIMMLEAGARQVSEELLVQALELAQTGISALIDAQEALVAASGKPKMTWTGEKVDPAREERIAAFLADKIRARVRNADKAMREQGLDELKREAVAALVPLAKDGQPADPNAITEADVNLAFDNVLKKEFRRAVLEEGLRPDGRGLTEIRPLSIEVGLLPRTHGSALFQRGQTQILSVATLGPSGDEQIIDTLSPVDSKRFMHHYNFPPYSVGEVRPLRGAGRREIGHGALAERALLPVIPTKEEFPYTIRVVSETLGSNGSTSMASTCGACLALMDAGVPMKAMIGGISIGLVLEGGQHRLLTDIQGMEDNYGDMDFKVTGSDRGVTAIQLDIKAKGLPVAVIREAFQQAKDARLFILNAMRAVLPAPRTELSKYAPRIETIKIAPDKVREVIGPGGKMVRQIQSETGTTIELEDDGTVRITGAKPEGREKARAMIEGLTKEPEVGEVYEGKVTRIMGIGAFVEYLPGKEGLVRISELSTDRVNRVEDVVNVGDTVTVKIAEVDRMGRVNLSIRAVSEGGDGYQERQRAERARYQDRDERGGPRRGGGGGFRRGGPPR